MTIAILQTGFIALIPSLTVIIILSLLGIGLYMLGRSVALRHLINHHIKDIARDEIEDLTAENVKYRLIIEQLKRDNRKFVDVLSGIRHLLR